MAHLPPRLEQFPWLRVIQPKAVLSAQSCTFCPRSTRLSVLVDDWQEEDIHYQGKSERANSGRMHAGPARYALRGIIRIVTSHTADERKHSLRSFSTIRFGAAVTASRAAHCATWSMCGSKVYAPLRRRFFFEWRMKKRREGGVVRTNRKELKRWRKVRRWLVVQKRSVKLKKWEWGKEVAVKKRRLIGDAV